MYRTIALVYKKVVVGSADEVVRLKRFSLDNKLSELLFGPKTEGLLAKWL